MSLLFVNKKLKAFTILELTIGLLIVSLVIGMVYFIYNNITQQIVSYSKDQEALIVYHQFQDVFSRDVKLSKNISFQDKRIEIHIFAEKITYNVRENEIIRNGKIQDTFDIKVADVTYKVNRKSINKYQTIKFSTEVLGRKVDFFEFKSLPVSQKINEFYN